MKIFENFEFIVAIKDSKLAGQDFTFILENLDFHLVGPTLYDGFSVLKKIMINEDFNLALCMNILKGVLGL